MTLHPFTTSRKLSFLYGRRPLSPVGLNQTRQFVLHRMLFTNIELDDFVATLSHFLAEERQWIMMAVTNIGAIMKYGRPGSMLSFVLSNPTRKASPFAESTLNPYLAVLLTFSATVSKHAKTLAILERFIPWEFPAAFFASIPKIFMSTSVGAPPLSEDWCMRSMEWVGRKVFKRGGEDCHVEIEVLDTEEGNQLADGIIQDEDADKRGSGLKETVD
ncbi:hypothetical protein L210DRAFT_3651846 [Boletus edulis BED1]|uniref:Uncharacterized protein n=1 Tax=Boletus edulis BED1 TaxID=1328754 RepID=A0AAD4BGQ1_BOLED|nr:hypothetical protein L210DRAFT_3651846 [Boletus edulis BED1]